MPSASPIRDLERSGNPYLGPRPFAKADAYRFFGRPRETADLYSLAAAHRTLLLYAQSGAGKTSLLSAGLIPLLENGGFDVLPTARVSGINEQALAGYPVENIYVLNCAGIWAEDDVTLNATLTEVLANRRRRVDAEGEPLPRIAVFDQFEELFTSYPQRWQERRGFFEQLNEAMSADPTLRVLFAMREDFVAQTDPYKNLLPERLRTRFRLEQLREEAARAAIEKPLEGTSTRFKPGVAERLVMDLLSETVAPGVRIPGEFVEPVQLQVVCFSLFRSLPAGTTEITEEHLAAFGDVDQALREFYQTALREAADRAATEEDSLRKWFECELITEAGTRGLVFRGEKETGGIKNAAVDALEELHIIRSEVRGRDRWYELSHDRFVQPVLRANDAWRARAQAAAIERERAEAARSRQQAEEQAGLARRFRRLFWGTVAILLLAVGLALAWLLRNFESTERALDLAAEKNLSTDPELSVLLASQAVLRARSPWTRWMGGTVILEAEDALRRGLQSLTPEVSVGVAGPGGDRRAHSGGVSAIAFSQDGARLATGSWDHTVRIWDVVSGAPRRKPFDHGTEVTGLAFSSDGARLAAFSPNGAVSVWEAESGRQLNTFNVGSLTSGVAALSPDERFLAVARNQATQGKKASPEGTTIVWDVQSGKAVSRLEGHRGSVTGAAFSVDAMFLATANADGSVMVWDGKTGKPRPPLFPGQGDIVGLSFSGDATRLAVAGEDGTVTVWDLGAAKSVKPLNTLPSHGSRVSALALSLDGKRIATAGADGRAKLWDVTSGEELPMRFPSKDYILALAFSPDGQRLATTSVDGTARVWDVSMRSAAEVVMTLPVPEAYGVMFSHRGQLLAIASNKETEVWNLASGQEFHYSDWGALNFTPDDSGLAIVTGRQGVKMKRMMAGGGELPHPSCNAAGNLQWVDFSSDWSEIVISDSDWNVKVCHKATGRESRLHTSDTLTATNIGAMSPDGKTVALGDLSGTLSLWDAASGDQKCSWKTNVRQMDIATFSNDGKRLATAGEHNTAQIWNSSCSGSGQVESSKQLRSTLSGHTGAVTAIAFSRDGTRVVTGSLDGTAKVWDLHSAGTPKELYSFSHASGVLYVDLSPDGSLLATVSADGYVRVYRLNIDADHLVSLARKRVHRNLTADECQKYVSRGSCAPLVETASK